MSLPDKKCVPCRIDTPRLRGEMLLEMRERLEEGWQIVNEHHLEKVYRFKNFMEGLSFVNKVGALAEEEGHHPDIFLSYGRVKLEIFSHKIDGLSENDFVLAAKADIVFHEGKID